MPSHPEDQGQPRFLECDEDFQEFDREGFQPVVHNEFLVEQAMWRQVKTISMKAKMKTKMKTEDFLAGSTVRGRQPLMQPSPKHTESIR